ncbi:hypothetical protein D3C83_332820 [compost metagenome]
MSSRPARPSWSGGEPADDVDDDVDVLHGGAVVAVPDGDRSVGADFGDDEVGDGLPGGEVE